MRRASVFDNDRASPPAVPAGRLVYAIGDIHGRRDLLDRMLGLLVEDMAAHSEFSPTLVFLGDYIDRGPDSCGVIDRLVEVSRLVDTVCLRGNHEAMLLDVLSRPQDLPSWCRNGGSETLLSYGVTATSRPTSEACLALAQALAAAMPGAHMAFFTSLERAYLCGDYAFVHAGVKPGVPFASQQEDDLFWIREQFLLDTRDHGKIVVHGHTPTRAAEILPNRINVDTGAFATGRLSCLALDGTRRRILAT